MCGCSTACSWVGEEMGEVHTQVWLRWVQVDCRRILWRCREGQRYKYEHTFSNGVHLLESLLALFQEFRPARMPSSMLGVPRLNRSLTRGRPWSFSSLSNMNRRLTAAEVMWRSVVVFSLLFLSILYLCLSLLAMYLSIYLSLSLYHSLSLSLLAMYLSIFFSLSLSLSLLAIYLHISPSISLMTLSLSLSISLYLGRICSVCECELMCCRSICTYWCVAECKS